MINLSNIKISFEKKCGVAGNQTRSSWIQKPVRYPLSYAASIATVCLSQSQLATKCSSHRAQNKRVQFSTCLFSDGLIAASTAANFNELNKKLGRNLSKYANVKASNQPHNETFITGNSCMKRNWKR